MGVTVITLTRGDRTFLRRCTASVRQQDYDGPVEHLIIGDDVALDSTNLPALEDNPQRTQRTYRAARGRAETNGTTSREIYPRLARMWNDGVAMANEEWIAFLDDDNEFFPSHLRTLVELALRHDVQAVHSSRAVVYADGEPYLDDVFPWAHDAISGRRIHADLQRRGVWEPGTNILHDRAGPLGYGKMVNSTIMTTADPVVMVDMSVWLIARELLLRHPVPGEYDESDAIERTAPDDKLLEQFLRHDVPIVSTRQPTLRYYLGGMSNS